MTRKRGFKKGQVTIWIILGIVVLAVVGGTIYLGSEILKSDWEKARERAARVPEQIVPVKDVIDNCIRIVGRDAIDLIGRQGGYIDISNNINLQIFSNNALEVPYWYYQRENGVDILNVPSLNFIETQISDYINYNLNDCLDFKELEKEGYGIVIGNANTITEVGEEGVLLTVDLPVNIEFKDLTFNIDKYYASFDVGLGKLYELADNIIRSETENLFLEEQTIDFLVLYDEIPFSGSEVRCSQRIWLRQDVISKLKEILSNNLQLIKVEGTDYSLPNRDYKRFLWNLDTGKNYRGIVSDFMFSNNWLLDLDVFPRNGDILKSESITGNLGPATGLAQSFLCLQNYHFIYDIKYPVLVKLIDKNSFGGEGYTFQFASEVVIDNNQPRENIILPDLSNDVGTRYCDKRFIKSTIYTFEKDLDGNLWPLEDVNIGYRCINHFCDIGNSEIDNYGDASLVAEFPSCINGEIVAEKEDYHFVNEQVSTNEEVELSLALEPYINKMLKIKNIGEDGIVRNLLPSEKLILQLIEDNKDYSVSIIYPDDEEIKLIPGDYSVSAFLVREGRIEVEDTSIERCETIPKQGFFGLLGATEEKCIETTLPGDVFDEVIVGGVDFEFSISNEDLKYDYIEFYIPSKDVPRDLEEMAQISFEVPENFIYPRFLNE